MKRKQPKSSLLEAVHETAEDLHKLGLIDKRTMREYDVLCVGEVSAYSPEQIRSLRERYRLSQAVMASVLNTSLSTIQKWEIGDKHPSGPSLKLLSILDCKGLEVLINN
jgi:putative transcriptional regulator